MTVAIGYRLPARAVTQAGDSPVDCFEDGNHTQLGLSVLLFLFKPPYKCTAGLIPDSFRTFSTILFSDYQKLYPPFSEKTQVK